MGYRGKIEEQQRCRELRSQGWTYNDIAATVGVSKSSVSLWCRDVEPDAVAWAARAGANRARGFMHRRPHPQHVAKLAEIERLQREGVARIGDLSEREFLVAGLTLYAGEGAKTGFELQMANCDPRIIAFFLAWFRHFFPVEERRLRGRMYLHEGLDLDAAMDFWIELTGIPATQWGKAYRPEARAGRGTTKHVLGCPSVG